MFEKTKNDAPRRPRRWLWAGVLALVGVMGYCLGYGLNSDFGKLSPESRIQSPPVSQNWEMVIVPSYHARTYRTYGQYTGTVTLLIQGTVQMNGPHTGDAFYTYLDGSGLPYATPAMHPDFMLSIDGESAYSRLSLSPDVLPYSPNHVYILQYDVGETPRYLSFGAADRGVADNKGYMTVTVFSHASWMQAESPPFVPTPTPEPVTATQGGELVTVPFSSITPITTQQNYSGTVTLVIRGAGQAGGGDSSDAFYLFKRSDGTLYTPPVLGEFAMELDGAPIQTRLDAVPDFNMNHVYVVTYDVGETPRPLAFRNTDLHSSDNTGQYYVEVIPIPNH